MNKLKLWLLDMILKDDIYIGRNAKITYSQMIRFYSVNTHMNGSVEGKTASQMLQQAKDTKK